MIPSNTSQSLLYLYGLLLAALAIFVFRSRPSSTSHRWFALHTVLLTIWTVAIAEVHGNYALEFWGRLTFAATSLVPPTFLAFSRHFPSTVPWLRAGFREGSGDSNPNDSTHNTFFEVLTGPRPFARVPFFDGTNIQDLNGHLIFRPHPKVTTSSEFHSLRLANPNDLWYSGGGVYQPWTFGYTGRPTSGRRSLANFYDTNIEYRVNRKLTLTGYFGYMQGLGSIELIYPRDKNGSYGYGELLYRF